MLRRRFFDRFFFPALIVAACGGESSDLFDSSGAATGSGGDDSAGEGPELTGGKPGATGGSNAGGSVTLTGGRSSAGATNGGSGEPSGGTPSGGRTGNGGRVGNGGRNGNGGITGGGAVGGESQGGAGSDGGGVANGGAHQGGMTVAGGKASCTDSDAADQNQRGTTKGSNGTFEDECAGDDLVEYSCEVTSVPGPCLATSMSPSDADLRPAPPIENCQVPTGKVIEHTVACDRGCRDGSCFYWCPTLEDEVLVERRGRDAVELTNLRTDDLYSCEVTFESENFDCRGSSEEGRTFPVSSLTCGVESLSLSVDSEDAPGVVACSYSCSYE